MARRKGYHQRKHKRNREGTIFDAGRGKKEVCSIPRKNKKQKWIEEHNRAVEERRKAEAKEEAEKEKKRKEYDDYLKRISKAKRLKEEDNGKYDPFKEKKITAPHDDIDMYGWIPTNIPGETVRDKEYELAKYGYVGEWKQPGEENTLSINPRDLNDRTLTHEDYIYGRKPWGIRRFDIDIRGNFIFLIVRISKQEVGGMGNALKKALGWFISKGGNLKRINFKNKELRDEFIKQLKDARKRIKTKNKNSIKITRVFREGSTGKYEVLGVPETPDDDEYFDGIFEDDDEIPLDENEQIVFVEADSRKPYEEELKKNLNILSERASLLKKLDRVSVDSDSDNVYLILAFERKELLALGWSMGLATVGLLRFIVGKTNFKRYVPQKHWSPGQKTRQGHSSSTIKLTAHRGYGAGMNLSEGALPPR